MKATDLIKKVKRLEITTKDLVEGLIAGSYHSVFKGQGIEFSDIREYQYGDDIRAIDWKVTARFGTPFVKQFIEERDLRVYFAFDFSASGSFGGDISKREKAFEVAASLMFSAVQNNDNVGLFIFTDEVELYIPARKGKKHLLKVLSRLISYKPKSSKTNLSKALNFISKVIKKRSVLFLISDFYAEDFYRPLKILRSRHDIVALRILDPREMDIPDVGLIELEDEETGEQILIDTSDKEFRENYKKIVRQREEALQNMFRKAKVDLVNIYTSEPYDVPLRKFFKRRILRLIRC